MERGEEMVLMETAGILRGMNVVDRTGQKIGCVAALFDRTGERTDPPNSAESDGPGPAIDPAPPMWNGDASTERGCVKVQQGGILGIGTTSLYIPFTHITQVDPGETVSVDCTREECVDLFGNKPAYLK